MAKTVDLASLAESAAKGNDDARVLFLGILSRLNGLGANKGQLGTPPAASISVIAANGIYTWHITNPSTSLNAPIYHEVSYSPVKNFSQNITTLPATPATGGVLPSPGTTLYFRLRSTYDQVNWTSYALAQNTASASGLQSSAAMANNAPLNQTNFANADSIAIGSAAAVRIYGSAPYRSYPRVVGTQQVTRPSGTIVNVPFNSTQIAAFDGKKFRISPILSGVFDDTWEPVGIVSVVGSGTPTLPTVSLVLGSGGTVIGWNVTSQGNGLTGPVTLSIVTSTGSGATAGTQTITNGKLISIAPGNPGSAYAGGDTVNVSGGIGSGSAGGGGSTGGNGGRLIAFGS